MLVLCGERSLPRCLPYTCKSTYRWSRCVAPFIPASKINKIYSAKPPNYISECTRIFLMLDLGHFVMCWPLRSDIWDSVPVEIHKFIIFFSLYTKCEIQKMSILGIAIGIPSWETFIYLPYDYD
ncbi:hypothetical protein Nepgr_000746 [Nepenthes gracilis]|uniref:Uncharacterized protein n=1 Tax=Nepenthes gracilis TaxID=150966 RepID=A0AAD3RVN4_NEPGR|nr:hypothetical protein Nepgr_000746 [Nepenthes gracilis]